MFIVLASRPSKQFLLSVKDFRVPGPLEFSCGNVTFLGRRTCVVMKYLSWLVVVSLWRWKASASVGPGTLQKDTLQEDTEQMGSFKCEGINHQERQLRGYLYVLLALYLAAVGNVHVQACIVPV